MIAFDIAAGADRDAIRRALARCEQPMRVERKGGRTTLIVDETDVTTHLAAWLRTGLGRPCRWRWPAADQATRGALRAGGGWWSLGGIPVGVPSPIPHAMLLLAPVAPGEAARAIAGWLMPAPWELRRRSEPRRLAHACGRILQRIDAVARARALALCEGPTPATARTLLRGARRRAPGRVLRASRDPAEAWREILCPSGGVWRLLSDLEVWWG